MHSFTICRWNIPSIVDLIQFDIHEIYKSIKFPLVEQMKIICDDTVKFPLFVYANDDKSMGIFDKPESFEHCEPCDIESDLYLVWDVTGERLILSWDSKSSTVNLNVNFHDMAGLIFHYNVYKNYYKNYFKISKNNINLCDFDLAEKILNIRA